MKTQSPSSKTSTLTGTIGHRGSRKQAPENTLASFQRAVDDGAHAIELDVQMSKDGEYVILHDDTLDRTTNGSGPVGNYSVGELKTLDAGSWFDPMFKGERLPTLSESLQWAKGKAKVDIEVKKEATASITPESLVQIVRDNGMEGQVAITSFDREFVEAVEEFAPAIETGVLLSATPALVKVKKIGLAGLLTGFLGGLAATGSVWPAAGLGLVGGVAGGVGGFLSGAKRARSIAQQTTTDAVLPNWLLATKALTNTAHQRGKAVVPYTVNNGLVGKILLNRGVDGLVTDRPENFT